MALPFVSLNLMLNQWGYYKGLDTLSWFGAILSSKTLYTLLRPLPEPSSFTSQWALLEKHIPINYLHTNNPNKHLHLEPWSSHRISLRIRHTLSPKPSFKSEGGIRYGRKGFLIYHRSLGLPDLLFSINDWSYPSSPHEVCFYNGKMRINYHLLNTTVI